MLQVEDLCVNYGRLRALSDVNLAVRERGTLHGIIGPNGAGKSTFIDAISGRCRPSRGRILLDGEDITRRSVSWRRHRGMARSFQRTSIFPSQTVGEQLELVAHQLHDETLKDIVDVLELRAVCDRVAETISYGDQRRVDVALAMIGNPRLILLDEPAAGLSSTETYQLFDHLRRLVHDRVVTAIVVEHDVEAVFRYCDSVTAFDLGRVLFTGNPGEVRSNPSVISAYLGSAA